MKIYLLFISSMMLFALNAHASLTPYSLSRSEISQIVNSNDTYLALMKDGSWVDAIESIVKTSGGYEVSARVRGLNSELELCTITATLEYPPFKKGDDEFNPPRGKVVVLNRNCLSTR